MDLVIDGLIDVDKHSFPMQDKSTFQLSSVLAIWLSTPNLAQAQHFLTLQSQCLKSRYWGSFISRRPPYCYFRKTNHCSFHEKSTTWLDLFEIVWLNASSWCTLSKSFEDFSIQDFYLNWRAFFFQLNVFFDLYCRHFILSSSGDVFVLCFLTFVWL